MQNYFATATKLDASGNATLSAHTETGPYYFFATVPNSGGSLVWDVQADLVQGEIRWRSARRMRKKFDDAPMQRSGLK